MVKDFFFFFFIPFRIGKGKSLYIQEKKKKKQKQKMSADLFKGFPILKFKSELLSAPFLVCIVSFIKLQFLQVKRVNCINCEIRPNRPNGPIGESRTSTPTCPTKVGPILSHGPPVGTKAQTCSSRFKKLVLQAREACPASLRGLFSRSR